MDQSTKKENLDHQKADPRQRDVPGRIAVVDWPALQDRDLVRMALQTDLAEPALVELWERYKKRLYFYIHYRIHWNPQSEDVQEQYVIEDLLQNIFFDVLENLRTYNPEYQVSTWVYTIANKHIMRYIREVRKHEARTMELGDVHDAEMHTHHYARPDDVLELKEFEIIVRCFIRSLKRRADREVFILFLQNLNTKNISEFLQKTHDSVRSRLNRVVKLFKRFLQKQYPEYYNSRILAHIRNLEISKTETSTLLLRPTDLNTKE